jgi:hypothetical protein
MFPHERSLVKRLEGKPFALVGVNSDTDKEKLHKANEEKGITWRSFWNGPKGTGGPISEKWNVHGWPTLYIIDDKGVIRQKWVGSPGDGPMDKAIDELLVKMGVKLDEKKDDKKDEKKGG